MQMVSFTIEDYKKYCKLFSNGLSDVNEEYKIESKEENKKEKNKKHQYHDKTFKELLDNKKEFVKFIKKYTECEIKESEIEKYNRKFNTKIGFKVRESDVIYKIKGEEIFILVEHQSTVDYRMPERIAEYCIAIINSRELGRKKQREYPIIYPIVLSTAKKKWDAKRTIEQEENNYKIPKQNYPIYNIVDINDYTIEELIKEGTGIALAMAFEKVETIEEMKEITKILKNKKLNEEERKTLTLILKQTEKINKYLGEEGIKEYEEIIMKGEDEDMRNFNEFVNRICDENYKQGRVQTIIEVAKEMLKDNVKDEDIIKYSHITKEELNKLKLQMG